MSLIELTYFKISTERCLSKLLAQTYECIISKPLEALECVAKSGNKKRKFLYDFFDP